LNVASLGKRRKPAWSFWTNRGNVHQRANTSHAFTLPRARSYRPCAHAADHRDELTLPH
jgi:hypothetical protein